MGTKKKKKKAESTGDVPVVDSEAKVDAPEDIPVEAPPPPEPPPPAPKAPAVIRFDEFRRRSGIRPEHFGSFARHISLEYGRDTQERKTFDGWKNAYDEYLNRPVIG